MAGFDVATTHRPLPGTHNLRDLGGVPVAGGRIAPGRLLRGEVIARRAAGAHVEVWDPAWAAEYAALGVRTVVDLRDGDEVVKVDSAWPDATGAEVRWIPLREGGEGDDTDMMRRLLSHELAGVDAADMGALMVALLDGRADRVAEVARTVVAGAPVLLHCTAGKDRTGAVVAVLLSALGADDATVVADYALTQVLRPGRVHDYADRFDAAGVRLEAVRVLFESPPEAMRLGLQHLGRAHGGAAGYLASAGFGASDLAALREVLVVP